MSSESCTVRMRIPEPGTFSRVNRHALRPSSLGIAMSNRITSGFSSTAFYSFTSIHGLTAEEGCRLALASRCRSMLDVFAAVMLVEVRTDKHLHDAILFRVNEAISDCVACHLLQALSRLFEVFNRFHPYWWPSGNRIKMSNAGCIFASDRPSISLTVQLDHQQGSGWICRT
jgi:hypothetical protein